MSEYNLLSSFMTSVGFFFVYLPLTSDEINNVVCLSPREDGEFYEPRTIPRERFCHACGNTSDRNCHRNAARNALISLRLREHDDEYFSYHRASPNHRGFSSHPPKGGDCRRNDLAGAVKNSSRGSKRLRVLDGARQRLHD